MPCNQVPIQQHNIENTDHDDLGSASKLGALASVAKQPQLSKDVFGIQEIMDTHSSPQMRRHATVNIESTGKYNFEFQMP